MKLTIEIKASARKDILALGDKLYVRVQKSLDAWAENPRPNGVRKLHGTDNGYRIRIGDYRALYEIDDSTVLVTVYRIKHSREAYR